MTATATMPAPAPAKLIGLAGLPKRLPANLPAEYADGGEKHRKFLSFEEAAAMLTAAGCLVTPADLLAWTRSGFEIRRQWFRLNALHGDREPYRVTIRAIRIFLEVVTSHRDATPYDSIVSGRKITAYKMVPIGDNW